MWTVIIMFTFVAQEWVEGLGRRNIASSIKINSTKRKRKYTRKCRSVMEGMWPNKCSKI